jgi:DNA (cytosine-5)-methyltransferase 1
MSDKVRVVELFAGVGGFRIGLEQASDRFVTVWANQWEPGRKDQFAFNCYDRHFSDTGSLNINDDIGNVKENVPDHDLLVGGFPCQDYSVAATNAKGIEGKKGVLWWHIHDIIISKRPKYVLLENVDRLVKSPASKRGRDFGIIIRCLADLDYMVEWRVINAAEYGLPQKRRRIFIFASRNDTPFAEGLKDKNSEDVVSREGFFAKGFPIVPHPKQNRADDINIAPSKYKTLVDVSNKFEGTFYNAGVVKGHKIYTRETIPVKCPSNITLGDILQSDVDERFFIDEENLEKWQYMKGSKKLERERRAGGHYTYSEGAIPFPDPLDRPGRTMLTSEGSSNRSTHVIMDPHKKRYRLLTPVECERLNGFPDDWTDTGMSVNHRYFTMGNALVIPLIERMGQRILGIEDVT